MREEPETSGASFLCDKSTAQTRAIGMMTMKTGWLGIVMFFSVCFAGAAAHADVYDDVTAANRRGDTIAAIKLLSPLAEKGEARAQAELGALYLAGKGGAEKTADGVKWTKAAAEKGFPAAQYNLGAMYLEGRGVSRDNALAMKWLLAAAGQGVAAAQLGVATMFADGEGVPENYEEAAKWMLLAAKQGDPDAQLNLGTMYALGKGLPRDVLRGAVWTYLATESQSFTADERKSLREMSEKTLLPEELPKIRELAVRCRDSGFKDCP